MEVLKQYENDKNYIQAFQEYKDLIAARSNPHPMAMGSKASDQLSHSKRKM